MEGRNAVEKVQQDQGITSNRDNCNLERILRQSPFKNMGDIHREWTAAGARALRSITHRYIQDMD